MKTTLTTLSSANQYIDQLGVSKGSVSGFIEVATTFLELAKMKTTLTILSSVDRYIDQLGRLKGSWKDTVCVN